MQSLNLGQAFNKNNENGQHRFIKVLNSKLQVTRSISLSDLMMQAKSIAVMLWENNCKKGDLVVLCYNDEIEFLTAFFGCIYAGIIAIPCYPPYNYGTIEKLIHIVQETKPKLILIDKEVKKLFNILELKNLWLAEKIISSMLDKNLDKKLLANINFLHVPSLLTRDINIAASDSYKDPNISNDDIAFLQYTSGSIAHPKGVMLTHNNLLSNIKAITSLMQINTISTIFSWLPLYHDLGLIGCVLSPIYADCNLVLMSPVNFLKNPLNWLKGIALFQATHSGGPNFAYDLCAAKAKNITESIDLSSWIFAFNAAEPIHYETLEHFTKEFEKYGFKHKAFRPGYGLAETGLFATVNNQNEFLSLTISKEKLKSHIIELTTNKTDAYPIVSCGNKFAEENIVIADTKKMLVLPEMHIGEICLSSPSIALGYWGKKQETEEHFHVTFPQDHRHYLRTGDLGFLYKDHLFITGRLKDVIIKSGKNYYPQDIEKIVNHCHPAIRKGCSAAIGFLDNDIEKIAVVVEIKNGFKKNAYQEIIHKINQAIFEYYNIHLDDIVIIKHRSIKKTTSGKIKRQKIKEDYLNHTLIRLNV